MDITQRSCVVSAGDLVLALLAFAILDLVRLLTYFRVARMGATLTVRSTERR
jgi:hypothetical protein